MKTPEEMFNALGNRGDYCGLPNVTMEEVRAIYAEGQTVLRAALNKLRFEATKAAGANPEDWVLAQVDLCQVLEDVSVMLGEKAPVGEVKLERCMRPPDEEVDYGHIIKFWNEHTAPGNPHHSIHEYLEWLWAKALRADQKP